MSTRLNHPRTLAWEPLDSEHILACPRLPLEKVQHILERAGKMKWIAQLQAHAKFECCKDPRNLDLEAWYSKAAEQEKQRPDIYKFYCRVCESHPEAGGERGAGCHVKFCVGGNHPLAGQFSRAERPELYDVRPFWEVR